VNHPIRWPRVVRVEVVAKPATWLKKVTAFVPLFVSVLALGTAIWSARATRTHNRLSVKPSVAFARDGASIGTGRVGLSVRNDGLGPAQIDQLHVYLDGVQITRWEETLRKAMFYTPSANLRWMWFPYSITLRPGESIPLYAADNTGVYDKGGFNAFIDKRLFVIVHVCSMYDECDYVCSTTEDLNCKAEELRVVSLHK
jgi:hypothetical protein